ncbi:MAG: HNH nuclease family protein [Lentisphaerae bacterium]|nr:HNH nuclease family protein [Lentisphaerota bacterium]
MRREAALRAQGYRERALRILPHVCASCGRAFDGRRLKELTVHHKDHNHDNNPPDGSNWELLCLYCHEFEHEKGLSSAMRAVSGSTTDRRPSGTFQPLAGLDALLPPEKP